MTECSSDGTCQATLDTAATTTTSPPQDMNICQDVDTSVCEYLSRVGGECESNANWMTTYCPKSCGICMSSEGGTLTNDYILKVGLDLGIPQRIIDANISYEKIQARLELARSRSRMTTMVEDDGDDDSQIQAFVSEYS